MIAKIKAKHLRNPKRCAVCGAKHLDADTKLCEYIKRVSVKMLEARWTCPECLTSYIETYRLSDVRGPKA